MVTANAYNLIDDDEFVLLYDAYSPKAIFPYWKFPKFDAEAWSDVECHTELRFAKGDLDGLLECLGIPDNIICQQRTVCGGKEALCVAEKIVLPLPLYRHGASLREKSNRALPHF